MKKILVFIVIVIIMLSSLIISVNAEIISNGTIHTGQKVVFFEDITIDQPYTGEVIAIFGNIKINSYLTGNVIAICGNVEVKAGVTGQIVGFPGDITLHKGSQVMGNVVAIGSVIRKEGSSILGNVVGLSDYPFTGNLSWVTLTKLLVILIWSIFVFIGGFIVIAIFSKRIDKLSVYMENDVGRSLIMGLLGLMAATILVILLAITVVAPIIYLFLLLASATLSCIFMGRLILKNVSPKSGYYTQFVTGLATMILFKVILLFMIPLDQIIVGIILYFVFNLFIYSLGLGIISSVKYGRKTI